MTGVSPTCRPYGALEMVVDPIPGLTPWAINMPAHTGLLRWRFDVADHNKTFVNHRHGHAQRVPTLQRSIKQTLKS